jgi:hydroxyacylglutathione hydrolase
MLIAGFPAGPFGTNCWILAPGAGQEAVIVDPGMDSADGIAAVIAEHRLRPIAVLVSHGHIDHMYSVLPVCDGYDIPAWIHPFDRGLLADPWAGMGADTRMMLAQAIGATTFAEPSDVRELRDGSTVDVAGLRFVADHAPGHTPGSTAFRLMEAADQPVMLSGDLLFAGSIGRTDLPGGDHRAMLASLARVVLSQPDDMLVLPGHGPTTTIGAERRSNPYLRGLPNPPAAGAGA